MKLEAANKLKLVKTEKVGTLRKERARPFKSLNTRVTASGSCPRLRCSRGQAPDRQAKALATRAHWLREPKRASQSSDYESPREQAKALGSESPTEQAKALGSESPTEKAKALATRAMSQTSMNKTISGPGKLEGDTSAMPTSLEDSGSQVLERRAHEGRGS